MKTIKTIIVLLAAALLAWALPWTAEKMLVTMT